MCLGWCDTDLAEKGINAQVERKKEFLPSFVRGINFLSAFYHQSLDSRSTEEEKTSAALFFGVMVKLEIT